MPKRLLLDGPDIEALLGQVHSDYGEQARIVHAERVRTGGIAGFFAKERYEVTIEVDDRPMSLGGSQAPRTSPSRASANGAESVALLVAEAMNQSEANVSEANVSEANMDDSSHWTPQVSTSGSAFAGVLDSLNTALGLDSGAQLVRVPRPAPEENLPPVAWSGDTTSPRLPEVRTAEAVSDPASPAPRAVATRGRNGQEHLANPPRPPRGAGQVLAVVGEATVAFSAGLTLARRMRIPSTRVLLASPDPTVPGLVASRRLVDATSARKRSLRLLSETAPTVVAVDLPIGAIWDDEAVDWAREIVDAVGAKTVWAMVDATRKARDLSRWLDRLDIVDALVVHNAAATQDLLPLRELGYPVAMLDDRPATAAVWRSMLSASDGLKS